MENFHIKNDSLDAATATALLFIVTPTIGIVIAFAVIKLKINTDSTKINLKRENNLTVALNSLLVRYNKRVQCRYNTIFLDSAHIYDVGNMIYP